MAAPSWQEAVAQQAEEVSSRLRDVLSAGVGLLRTELGLQLPSGLEPQRLPTWLVLLSTSLLALLVLLGLLWAATCARAGDARKKRPGRAAEVEEEEDEEEDDDEEEETAVVGLTGGGGSGGPNKAAPGAATMLLLKGEEQKKRNKKKPPEKMGRLNGQPVHEVSEEEIMQTVRRDNLKQPSDAEKKTEKSKKNKKKPKGDTKTVQDQSRTEGKEIDEGAWETKISNREKRQQRKRDKVLTDAGSESNLPGMENSVTVSTEQLTSTTSFSVGPRKSKGDSTSNIQVSNSKSGKGDAVLQQGLNEGPTVNGGNWNEKPVKLSSQIGTSEEKWTSVSSAGSKKKSETSAWGKDAADNGNGKEWGVSLVGRTWGERTLFPSIAAWSGVDGRINTPEQSSASFTSLGLNPAVSGSSSESVSQPGATDFQWDLNRNQAHIDDEWSGLNGLSPADPSSDWNAPAEEWGNWVEEEKAPSTPQLEEALSEVQKISDDDREKTEPTLNSTASGKSKKKKKKKKKQGEEASSPVQDAEDLDRDAGEECSEDTSKVQQEEISFSLKTISTSEEAEPEEMPSFAVSTEPSVTVSENESDKIPSQVPQMLQETEVPISNVKQNSVPPPQTKSEESWESPKQIKKKKKARRET
ncbi:PREDICTED: protein LYRIC isoform X1 [Gekko japonicus]|uniref:Protein LYRIC isoform X1 n=1 Tax=Gekko japonicus TaxID=146911 RepID=A0ABM1JV63_GEKJA|nr:PREDICTED: protein LYRIC isoform X1 [Gekko japonicus]